MYLRVSYLYVYVFNTLHSNLSSFLMKGKTFKSPAPYAMTILHFFSSVILHYHYQTLLNAGIGTRYICMHYNTICLKHYECECIVEINISRIRSKNQIAHRSLVRYQCVLVQLIKYRLNNN